MCCQNFPKTWSETGNRQSYAPIKVYNVNNVLIKGVPLEYEIN